ncbi:MAG: hypothetical protein ACE5K4_09685 [Candidatus Hydrothermarchaeota archaeon]
MRSIRTKLIIIGLIFIFGGLGIISLPVLDYYNDKLFVLEEILFVVSIGIICILIGFGTIKLSTVRLRG